MIKVADAEYKSFDEVQAITDPATKHEAVIAWGKFEHQEKKNQSKQAPDLVIDEDNEDVSEDTESAGKDTEKDTEEENKEEESESEEEQPASTAQETDTENADSDKETDSTAQETDTGNTEEEKAKQVEERAKEFAQHHNVPIEEAKKYIESAQKIKEKYDGNVDEIALAAYNAQSQYAALQNNLRKQQILRSNPYEFKDDHVIFRNIDANGKLKEERIEKDHVIDTFREKNQSDCEDLDDEAVYKMAKRDSDNWFKSQIEKTSKIVEEKAIKATNDFIANMPEKDKEYIPMFKQGIEGLTAEEIASDDSTLVNVLNLVKGLSLDSIKEKHKKELVEAEKRGFERGKKNAKILGEEVDKPKGSAPSNSSEKKFALTDAQKLSAEAKYGSFGVSKERMYELYTEELKSRKKK